MLYIIATPIGNLEDISERAKRILQSVDLVACEDTRRTRILLNHIGSTVKTISFHEHSDEKRQEELLRMLKSDQDIALVSDAGTPNVADPGGKLVQAAHQHQITVVPVPGPSAITAALSACGFAIDGFTFYGFLPKKKGKQTLLKTIAISKMASVFFESPERMAKTLRDCHDILGEGRMICICRELTKQFEQIWVGSVKDALVADILAKGEFVVVVEGMK